MITDENWKVFEREINMISDLDLKEIVINHLKNTPNYFYKVPSSSTGKYHPLQDTGIEGLVRHSKSVVYVGLDLLRTEQFVSENNYYKDIIISSGLLHDTRHRGDEEQKYSVAEHPILSARAFSEESDEYCDYLIDNGVILNDVIRLRNKCTIITKCILSHSGKWNTKYNSKEEIIPKPKTNIEKLVHLADYIASRKYINMYDLNNNKIN